MKNYLILLACCSCLSFSWSQENTNTATEKLSPQPQTKDGTSLEQLIVNSNTKRKINRKNAAMANPSSVKFKTKNGEEKTLEEIYLNTVHKNR